MLPRLFGNKSSMNKFYGTIDENGVGKFNDITVAALRGIRELGTTHVWYTGIIEHATLTDYTSHGIVADDADVVKGRAGSPYAIKDYYDVSPDLAVDVSNRMNEFEDLVRRTHDEGINVLIDFVPNHVARQYHSDARPAGVKNLGEDDDRSVSFHPNNNFYYLPGQSFTPPVISGDALSHPTRDGKFEENPAKATGNDEFKASPGEHSWYETVKLNYGVDVLNNRATHFDPIPDTWLKMRDILAFWVGKNIDGFRCDMAEMVPVEFWEWVIPEIRAIRPEIIFIAEIYNTDQYRNYSAKGKFDFLYDKSLLYDTLRLLVNGQRRTTDIADIQDKLAGINHQMLHFLENHDEQRIASRYFAGNPWKALPAFVVSAAIDQGPVMIYFGQEVGEPATAAEGFEGDDGRTSIFDYWGVPEHQKWMNNGKFDGGQLSEEQKRLRAFYSRLLTFVSTSPAITSGEYVDITAHNTSVENFPHQVHAFVRFRGVDRLLIVTGFNDKDLDIKVQIPRDLFERMGLDSAMTYVAKDMIWGELEAEIMEERSLQMKIKPFSCFIFRINTLPQKTEMNNNPIS